MTEATHFSVKDMSCDRCAERVRKAILVLHPQAKVDVDLATGVVKVTPPAFDAEAMAEAIAEAGYPASLVDTIL